MDSLQKYNIGFVGLSHGVHRFDMAIGQDFFESFPGSVLQQGQVQLELMLEKRPDMLIFDFLLRGSVQLDCDRCLGNYAHAIDHRQRLYVKFGEQVGEESEDVFVIPHGESHFDVAQHVYEYLHLELPIRRIHPSGSQGEAGCDQQMIRRVHEHTHGRKRAAEQPGKGGSQWEALKKLKFKES